MKHLHTLIVFLLTASLYAQTPTTVLQEINNLNAPMTVHGNDLYYVSDSDHVFKIDLTEADPTPQAVISTLSQNYDSYSIFDLAFHGDALYLSVANVIGDHSLTDILKIDLTANTLTTERVIAFTVPSSPIAILGNDLYMAISGIRKVDLTAENPTSEVVMASLPEDHTSETFSDFIFDGNILYMASRGESNNTGVFKVDVTAENPVYEKIVESGDVVGIALNGNSLYYDRGANRIQRIQDVNAGTLTGADLVTSGIVTMGQLAVHNNHLYIADPGADKIVKYPLTPFEGIYELGQPMAVHGDDLYYVSDQNHIYKIDLTAENPVTEAVVSFSGENDYSVEDLAFHGDMLYVSESNNVTRDIISRIDLTTDPPSIEEVYQTDANTLPPISFLGDYIYFINATIDGQYQLLRLDVTAPTFTAEIVTPLPDNGTDIAFHGNDLYLTSRGNSGINYRVDVTSETPVLEELSLEGGSTIKGLVLEGNRLYYSVSNSIRMVQEVASELVDGVLESRDFISEGLDAPYGLAIHNNQLYIANTDADEIVIHELPPPVPVQIWEGEDLVFTKTSGADWTLETHQDRITESVWITRQNKRPIYNYKWWQDTFNTDASQNDLQFEFFGGNQGPNSPTQNLVPSGGTQRLRWAILDDTGATTDNWDNFSMYGTLGNPAHFYSFNNVVTMIDQLERQEEVTIHSVIDNFMVSKTDADGTSNIHRPNNFRNILGKKLGVWIKEENIYFTLTFNSWDFAEGEGSGEGGFSYTRSTDDSLSSDTPETSSQIILAPNPVRDRMYVYGLKKPSSYRIYNLLGIEVSQGWLTDGGAVEVKPLPKGLYLLKLQDGSAIKFVKE